MDSKKAEKRAKKLIDEIGSPFETSPNRKHVESNVIRYMVEFSEQEKAKTKIVLRDAYLRIENWMRRRGVYRDADRIVLRRIEKLLNQ